MCGTHNLLRTGYAKLTLVEVTVLGDVIGDSSGRSVLGNEQRPVVTVYLGQPLSETMTMESIILLIVAAARRALLT